MSPEISERSFEEAIECGLLQHGPDACAGDTPTVRETPPPWDDTPPGRVAEGPQGGTAATVTYTDTALGPEGERYVVERTAPAYETFMRTWEAELNRYLHAHRARG